MQKCAWAFAALFLGVYLLDLELIRLVDTGFELVAQLVKDLTPSTWGVSSVGLAPDRAL